MVNSTPTSEGSGRKLFYGLFIFPLIIAVGMAVLLCTVVLLTRESETPESLIAAIKTGSPSKRWQKAFELSNELNQGRGLIRSSGVMKEIVHILNQKDEYDEKTRSYMVLALNHFEGEEVSRALMEALQHETSVDVQLFLLWALGAKRVSTAEEQVARYLENDRVDLRKMAAYALGSLGSSASVEPLAALLNDGEQDVRWNAALSLARLGSDAGYSEILNMIDRETLSLQGTMAPEKIEEIMISGIKGIALMGRKDARPYLETLSKEDESLKVRQQAIETLQYMEKTEAAA